MATLRKHELRAFVQPNEYRRLEKEALSWRATMAKTVRDCLNEYLQLREELATAIQTPGDIGEEHTGKIIHTLLARTEERIAVTIERLEERISALQEQNLFILSMIDRLYLSLMQHLPEVPTEVSDGVMASARRRHNLWIKAVEKHLYEK